MPAVIAFHISARAMINVRNAPARKAETGLKEKPIMTQPTASDPNMTARPMHSKATRLISSISRLGNNGWTVGEPLDAGKSH